MGDFPDFDEFNDLDANTVLAAKPTKTPAPPNAHDCRLDPEPPVWVEACLDVAMPMFLGRVLLLEAESELPLAKIENNRVVRGGMLETFWISASSKSMLQHK